MKLTQPGAKEDVPEAARGGLTCSRWLLSEVRKRKKDFTSQRERGKRISATAGIERSQQKGRLGGQKDRGVHQGSSRKRNGCREKGHLNWEMHAYPRGKNFMPPTSRSGDTLRVGREGKKGPSEM